MSVLEVKNLTYTYSDGTPFKKDALRGVDFSVQDGETVGIIGMTGSGKSTLVQHLNGLIKPQSGEIYFNGENIRNDKKCKSGLCFEIGLVFQYPEYQLFEDTVRAEIAYGPSNMDLSDDEINKRVLYVCKALGIEDELLNVSPFDLSGGQKRRVAIAGIMSMMPKVLILDEPSAGLDPMGRNTIYNAINEYKKSNNASVIIVSHSMEEVSRLCDKVLVLKDGKSVMFDTTQKVFENEDLLLSCGLELPQITRVCKKLNESGMNIPKGIFTVNDAADAIALAIKGGGGNA